MGEWVRPSLAAQGAAARLATLGLTAALDWVALLPLVATLGCGGPWAARGPWLRSALSTSLSHAAARAPVRALLHTATASITRGDSLSYLRLQADLRHGVLRSPYPSDRPAAQVFEEAATVCGRGCHRMW